MEGVAVRWKERLRPLPPAAVVGAGEAAGRLLRRLAGASAEELGALEGAAAPGLLALLSRAPLPWADGVVYLGVDPAAPLLLLPTAVEPEVHPALLEQAIRLRVRSPWRVAVVLDPPRLIELEAPRPLDLRALVALEARVRG